MSSYKSKSSGKPLDNFESCSDKGASVMDLSGINDQDTEVTVISPSTY